jgi:hypothetical protein
MQRLTLISLAASLLMDGCGFRVAAAFALRLLLANGTYGAIMPRVVRLFMCVLEGVIVQSRARTRLLVLPLPHRGALLHCSGDDRPLRQGTRPLVPCMGRYRLDRLGALHLCGCAIGACKGGA